MLGNSCFQTFWPKNRFFLLKTGFFWPKNRKLFLNLFLNYFREFEKTGYFQKISELWKPNYSKTCENQKFGKFRLMQGLIAYRLFSDPQRAYLSQIRPTCLNSWLPGSRSVVSNRISSLATFVARGMPK
jgi:hypothetical protein